MGKRNTQKAEFLQQHPRCCFCGGERTSTTQDHVPARTSFKARIWPDGFVFPACSKCNDATRYDEMLIAALSMLYPDGTTPEEREDFRSKMHGIANNIPGALESLQPSATEVRRFLRENGIKKDVNRFLHEYPLLKFDSPFVIRSMRQFGRKLFLALHYRHTGRPLPPKGGIAAQWFTNVQIENGVIPRGLADILRPHSPLTRGGMELHDQFFYWHTDLSDPGVGAYLAFFRQSFAIIGYVREDISTFEEIYKDDALTPFSWQEA